MPPPTTGGSGIVFGAHTAVRPLSIHTVSVRYNTYFAWRNLYSLGGYTYFNETCHKCSSCEWALLKSFQGQRSKVKVTLYKRVNAITAEAYISTVWGRGSLISTIGTYSFFALMFVCILIFLCCFGVMNN